MLYYNFPCMYDTKYYENLSKNKSQVMEIIKLNLNNFSKLYLEILNYK